MGSIEMELGTKLIWAKVLKSNLLAKVYFKNNMPKDF